MSCFLAANSCNLARSDLAGIRAAKAKAQERGQKVKATRQGNSERRK